MHPQGATVHEAENLVAGFTIEADLRCLQLMISSHFSNQNLFQSPTVVLLNL